MRNLEQEWVTQEYPDETSLQIRSTNLPRLYDPVRKNLDLVASEEAGLHMLSSSHEVLISCIEECTEDDDEDERSNFRHEVDCFYDADCILTESSQPPRHQSNLMIKQRALLSQKFGSKDSGYSGRPLSSEQIEFLSLT